jgi:hypothetical protein
VPSSWWRGTATSSTSAVPLTGTGVARSCVSVNGPVTASVALVKVTSHGLTPATPWSTVPPPLLVQPESQMTCWTVPGVCVTCAYAGAAPSTRTTAISARR